MGIVELDRPAARGYGVKLRRTVPLRLAPHPNSPSDQEWTGWVQDSPEPIAIDLFCGAGGLSYGLGAAGYRVALAADNDKWALESHQHNIAGRILKLDLAEQRARDLVCELLSGVDVGLIAGGPPCQPFSRAGLSKMRSLVEQGVRSGGDSRRELWRAFLEIVEAVRPRAVLMENVPDMALGDGFQALRELIERLGEIGYEADARIVDTWRHGVPQNRQRLIVVALRDGVVFEWPEELSQATVRDAIYDLPRLNVSPDAELGAPTLEYGAQSPRSPLMAEDGSELLSEFAARARESCTGEAASVVHDHSTRPVRADDFEAFKLMDGRTLYSELPEDLRRYRADIFNDKYNRLSWDELSRTITAHLAKDGYWYIHPEQHRTLTVREAARLQTFPDDFRFAGHRSHQFQQIGNAVPPGLAQQIGSAILQSLRGHHDAPNRGRARRSLLNRRNGFRESILHWVNTDSNARCAVESLSDGAGQKQRWADLLAGRESGLVSSAPALRVAARVAGDQNGRQPRGVAVRMELAKLVGLGDKARVLNAAAHTLGVSVCKLHDPLCQSCPVSAVCSGRSSAGPTAPAISKG
ncbi:MAG: DNA cytosine methyltransferase [Boseongicola sp. SB0677_bin_26]|nr:DNA cytosine methyltransferase [Boseongicola sp. SB0677_bin_26]